MRYTYHSKDKDGCGTAHSIRNKGEGVDVLDHDERQAGERKESRVGGHQRPDNSQGGQSPELVSWRWIS